MKNNQNNSMLNKIKTTLGLSTGNRSHERKSLSRVSNQDSHLNVQSILKDLSIPEWRGNSYYDLSRDGYQRNVIVYRCVNLIAKGAASVPWTLKKADNDIENHELLALMNRPNAITGGAKFWESVINYLLIAGNAYIEISFDEDLNKYQLNTLRPDRVTIASDKKNKKPIGFFYQINDKEKKLYPIDPKTGASNILHLKNFHPLNDLYGMSPIEAASRSIDQHNAVSNHNLAVLQNGGRPSGILMVGKNFDTRGGLTTEQENALKDIKDNLYGGYGGSSNAGKMMVIQGDLEWKEIGFSPKDLDFIDGKKLSSREIAQAFNVPPMLVGVPGDATFANYKEARFHLWEDTILPLLDSITDELNHWLAPRFGDDLTLGHSIDGIPALAPHREKLWKKIEDASFLTINEKRQMLGFPKIDTTKSNELYDNGKTKNNEETKSKENKKLK